MRYRKLRNTLLILAALVSIVLGGWVYMWLPPFGECQSINLGARHGLYQPIGCQVIRWRLN